MSRACARLFSFPPPTSPACRADAKEFQFVADRLELVPGGHAPLNLRRKTFLIPDNSRTFRASQMMVMTVVALASRFKPCRAAAEIKPLDQAHFFGQAHDPADRRQIKQPRGKAA